MLRPAVPIKPHPAFSEKGHRERLAPEHGWIECYDVTRESGGRFEPDTNFLIRSRMRSAAG